MGDHYTRSSRIAKVNEMVLISQRIVSSYVDLKPELWKNQNLKKEIEVGLSNALDFPLRFKKREERGPTGYRRNS